MRHPVTLQNKEIVCPQRSLTIIAFSLERGPFFTVKGLLKEGGVRVFDLKIPRGGSPKRGGGRGEEGVCREFGGGGINIFWG